MEKFVLTLKIKRYKPRHNFLFDDGEFRPKTEKSAKVYRRRQKHRNQGAADQF